MPSTEGVVQDLPKGPVDKLLGLANGQSGQSGQMSKYSDRTQADGTQEKTFDSNETIYIDFEEGDTRSPANFSLRIKWSITIMACIYTFFSASVAGSYNMGFESMTRDLNCSSFQATIGLSVYALGFGLVPLVTASFSEEFGRQPLYIYSSIGFLLMFMMIALAKNIQTVIIARFLQGAFGSTGSTMVGGTVADIWSARERGLPMSLFALTALGGTGIGPAFAGWIEMNSRLGWRWIQWIQMIIFGVYTLLLPVVMRETRSVILLMKLAKKMRKETGENRYRARVEDERPSLKSLIFISCTRPVLLMCTEPIVLAFSLWIGFAWGLMYCLVESIGGVFKTLHGFNIGQVGTVFLAMTIGSVIGFACNYFQEPLYRNSVDKRGPEARLHMACFAAILLPVALFIFAWTGYEYVHWIAQAIGIIASFYIWATFIIYLAVFSYLADCYGPFASSALAGQSLARNLMATAFPLFSEQMFHKLGYRWANTLFACLAVIMIPIPFGHC
ncbi:hypothetical protein DXG01_013494 [Tephrocybe rancida]|nr:hypothetical protein DXG01_013494 [Tephrocybe rancida]